MIKRSSKKFIENLLKNNSSWNILDIGCGYTAHESASVICDVQDLSNFYKDKKFIRLNEKTLPFKDKEFDFVIASHVLEHVEDIDFFIKELERVSTKGYIELPTILEDNLVFENKKDHLWHMEFDHDNNQLVKVQFIQSADIKIELLEPMSSKSPISNFIDYHGSGSLYHIAYEVNNLDLVEKEIIRKKGKIVSRSKNAWNGMEVMFAVFIEKNVHQLVEFVKV